MIFQDLDGKEVAASMEPVDPYRSLPTTERALMGMVERLGYTVPQAAQILGIDRATAHRKYWLARQKIRPTRTLRDTLLDRTPELLPRDLCALEMVEVLEYSIGRAARVLGVNKGHLCRRLAIARALIKSAGDPRIEQTGLDQTAQDPLP